MQGPLGATVTITGTYLNLIEQVVFATNKVVAKANFVSQTRDKIEVKVPVDAKSGKIAISNGQMSARLLWKRKQHLRLLYQHLLP